MKDSTLQRVWDARKAISERCDFDSHKLARYYQSRKRKSDDRAEDSKKRATGQDPVGEVSTP